MGIMDSDQTTCTIPGSLQVLDETRWTACLVVVRGVGTGNKILLSKPEIVIGRGDEADVRLAKAGVSRRHAAIQQLDGGSFRLIDLQSTNGTFVNAERIQDATLKDQDLIAVGESRLKFIAADSPEQPYYEELYCQAQLDKALQIYNKHYFLTRLDEELRRHQRAESALSLVLLDVDHFKRLNDSHGHLAGDAALVHLVDLVKQRLHETHVLCRYGGEEFGIVMAQTDLVSALSTAEEIRQLVASTPVLYANAPIPMTISLGISSHTAEDPKSTCEAMIVQADKALYAAKHHGRNRSAIFDATMVVR